MIVDFRKLEELLPSNITQTNQNLCLSYNGGSSKILIRLPLSNITQTNLNICLSYKRGSSEKLIRLPPLNITQTILNICLSYKGGSSEKLSSSSLGHNLDKPEYLSKL
jgi:hypothetical protein